MWREMSGGEGKMEREMEEKKKKKGESICLISPASVFCLPPEVNPSPLFINEEGTMRTSLGLESVDFSVA